MVLLRPLVHLGEDQICIALDQGFTPSPVVNQKIVANWNNIVNVGKLEDAPSEHRCAECGCYYDGEKCTCGQVQW